ncbi:molybdopterin synthase sulfur carrier subunit [Arenicella chitinivorans]|uniref:Molybdopterin synthase sulfur carrier subunit n=1 Tax=Arenicella chitinivorans TaxID=1329800 RepID=A0A918RR53_9GAMM|nr:MoaD/ThiS family protein [Arenicella chitinivorans]GHA07037.1 molybdopterin synthase sulfur carrier subunit [Arenicella chitinivorans]
MIKVRLFAHLRELAGTDTLEIPIGVMRTTGDLLDGLTPYAPSALIEALDDQSAMISVDQRYAGWEAPLHDGAEVGILPPVSGG